MEIIASGVSKEILREFDELFLRNLIES